jgi:hypothetical protein
MPRFVLALHCLLILVFSFSPFPGDRAGFYYSQRLAKVMSGTNATPFPPFLLSQFPPPMVIVAPEPLLLIHALILSLINMTLANHLGPRHLDWRRSCLYHRFDTLYERVRPSSHFYFAPLHIISISGERAGSSPLWGSSLARATPRPRMPSPFHLHSLPKLLLFHLPFSPPA